MKIVVIGYTAHVRSETVERLRKEGHDVVAASPKPRFDITSTASRDPGHAGKSLREFLENTAAVLRNLWLGRHLWLGRLQRCLGGRARGRREDGVR
jgi:hypothetical protein